MVTCAAAARAEPASARLSLVVDPEGAEVLVDERSVGRSPIERPIRVAPGLRAIRIRARGHVEVSRIVEVRPHALLTLSIVLEPQPGRAAEPEPLRTAPRPEGRRATAPERRPPRAELGRVGSRGPRRAELGRVGRRPRRHPSRRPAGTPVGRGPLLWAGVGLTVAAIAAASITGVMALEGEAEYRDEKTPYERRRTLHGHITDLTTATDVALDVAIGLGLATLVLFLAGGPDDDADARQASAPGLRCGGRMPCVEF